MAWREPRLATHSTVGRSEVAWPRRTCGLVGSTAAIVAGHGRDHKRGLRIVGATGALGWIGATEKPRASGGSTGILSPVGSGAQWAAFD
jgi:hypothetical protein